jgi:hypothetical protein
VEVGGCNDQWDVCNDIEAARLQSNQTPHATHDVIGTPDDLWEKRTSVAEQDRGSWNSRRHGM